VSISYIEEIKKRKYTKEFHSFIKSCVSTCLNLRYPTKNLNLKKKKEFFIIRCSSDELQTHSFFKYQKKFNHNRHLLYNDMAKLLEIYKTKESMTTEIKNIEQIFGKSKPIHIENNADFR